MTKTRKGERLPCVSTGLFTGPILGRVGAPPTLMAGGLLCCVGCIGSSLAPNIYVLIVCFGVLTGIVFLTIVCFGVLTGIVCYLHLFCCADRCHNTNFTLIHSLTPFCLYRQKPVNIHNIFYSHIHSTLSYTYPYVTVSFKTTKRILNIYFNTTIT